MSCLFYTFILMNAFNMFKSLKIFKLQFVKFPPLKYMYIFSTKLQVYYITIYAINLCQKCDSQAVLILSTRQETEVVVHLTRDSGGLGLNPSLVYHVFYHPFTLKRVSRIKTKNKVWIIHEPENSLMSCPISNTSDVPDR